jgi:hypothetical protein
MSSLVSHLRYAYFAYLSQPSHSRPLYRFIRRNKVRRILELGIGTTERAQRLIEVATDANRGVRIEYAGVDLFELRAASDFEGVSLKLAHRRLATSGAKVRLIPGDPFAALARTANSLGGTELVIISADQSSDALSQAWFYLPRVVTPSAGVFVEEPTGAAGALRLRRLGRDEIDRLAGDAGRRRAA